MYQDLPHSWPLFVREILNSLSIMNFNIELIAPECTVGNNYSKFVLKILFPLIFPTLFALFFVFVKIQTFVVYKFGQGKHPAKKASQLTF